MKTALLFFLLLGSSSVFSHVIPPFWSLRAPSVMSTRTFAFPMAPDEDLPASATQQEEEDATSQSKKIRETDAQSSNLSNEVSSVGSKASEEQQPVGASERGKTSDKPKEDALAFIKSKLENAKVDSGIITKMCDVLAEEETVEDMLQSCNSKWFFRAYGLSKEQINQLTKISWLNEFYQRQSVEYFLQGKIGWLSGPHPEIKMAIERFNHNAVSVDRPRDSWPIERTNDIRLIYGPSGSGKTFYALKGLSQERIGEKKPLVLYANLSNMRNDLGATVDTAKKWLEGVMTRSITELLKEENLAFDSKKKLDMTISVVLDEAMDADYLIKTKTNLDVLFSVLIRFCTSPCLIVTGVGIEECTKTLASGVDVGKWRMRHWGKKNFDACVKADMSLKDYVKEIGEVIKMHPFLEQLMTNARSAYFLAEILKSFAAENVQQPPEFVAVVAQHVAAKYIARNGLRNTSKEQRIKVVRAVLRLLWESSASRNDPIWPHDLLENQFADNKRFVSEKFDDRDMVLIFCLLDINVEYQGGKLTQVNKKRYPVEISPALTIVLYQLLGVLGTKIASRWSDFEVLAALNELSLMVIFSESVDKPFQLRFLSKPVPMREDQKNYDIPRVSEQCVYVNGDKAPYADVLAPGRFIQCKYTATPSKGCRFNITHELGKMGLLQNDESKAKAYTMALCDQWDKNIGGEKIDKVIKRGRASKAVSERAFHQAYPVCALLQRRVGFFSDYVQYVLLRLEEKNILQAENNKEICFKADDEFKHNITAVVYTNADFLVLVYGNKDGNKTGSKDGNKDDNKDGKEGGKHKILITDVDREGALRSDHSFYKQQTKLVGSKVALQFIFVRNNEVLPEDTNEKVG